jgi:heat shock protein 5
MQFVTRQMFESLNQKLFEITMKCVKDALDGAGLTYNQIDDIVLVGGSTRIPKIQEMIKESFQNSQIIKTINVDEAVAIGAAIEAGKISKIIPESFRVTEVTPFSLGVEVREGMSIIISRFTTIPVEARKFYTTTQDNQESVEILVYEGENEVCKDNNLLGEFIISGISKMRAGKPKIEVTFTIDGNGILKVTAIDELTGDWPREIDYNQLRQRQVGRC